MFRHCVAGIDFSAGWDQVKARLRRMAPLLGIRRLTLVHVEEPNQWRREDVAAAAAGVRLTQAADDLAASLGLEVQSRLVAGFAASALLEQAARERADLIVVANRSHSRGQELFMGNVALNLARMSTLPLLIVPLDLGGLDESAPLLLVSDNSSGAAAARRCFAGLLAGRAGRVALLADGAERSPAEVQALDELVAGQAGVEFAPLAGEPAAAVCRLAEDLGAPLIVVGQRRPGGVGEPFLDGRVESLCRQARSPVLLVPA
ncbi:universal stress protein [Pseudomonas stutzeri]|nr:universal stress protein [Stutzerimonas stutzeri]